MIDTTSPACASTGTRLDHVIVIASWIDVAPVPGEGVSSSRSVSSARWNCRRQETVVERDREVVESPGLPLQHPGNGWSPPRAALRDIRARAVSTSTVTARLFVERGGDFFVARCC